jgi:hypothetical protein
MAYRTKGSRLVRTGKASRTTVTTFERPADLPAYQESDAEKAARLGDVVEIEKRTSPDGKVVVYCVPGLEPDCRETLEEAGLIKHYRQGSGSRTEVYEPHNPRVIAWQMSVNRWCASQGEPPMFPGVPIPIEATDTVQ